MGKRHRRSILCPNCRKLISVDESRCPYCGIARPGSWWKSNLWTQGFLGGNQLIRTIIYANIAMYLISLFLDPQALSFSSNLFSILSPSDKSLLLLGATGVLPIERLHRWWTLVSANYLHAGVLHILFNMFAFRHIATLVLREYGTYRMVCIYTLSGIFGFWVSYLAGVSLTMGASAAVLGLIGAALYYGKSRGGAYGQSIYRNVGGWVIGLFIFGFLVPGINNWGHGGGIFAGIVLGFLLGYQERKRENLFHKILSGACLVVTAIILVWAVVSAIHYRVLGN